MSSPLTLRIDKTTRARINRIARSKQLSTSEVVRQAIEGLAERHEEMATPYEAMRHLVGIVDGGNPKRSTQTGRAFTKLLKARRKKS